ncbi:Ig-like domain-containing protein [Variovorax sp. EBFNA2]|uniref:Ig-like domain-containing protein n=1 Tax=Variovorax sp. EBFNA2 TaxID=3342097 RepID=UPI0029C0BC97|nr:Ig-like domain-containing protein [Variovorax boronicumulans]WPG35933.1 Ig-like domain-containing protein [Variovorax boronicumulans]
MASEKTTIAVDDTNIGRAASAGMSTFTVQPPVLDGAFDNAGDIQGNLAPGSITDDRQPEFHGQGTPGDTIVIQDNGTEIGKARVGASGLWSFTPSTDMGEGLHAITLIARDASGNESAPSAPFNFEIDVTPPDASQLAITGVLDTVGGITGNITSGAATDDARPLISGTSSGVPGHTVIVRVRDASGERELGRAVIGEHGNWTLQVDVPLASGQNMLRVYEVDVAGNETALTAPYRVTVNTEKPAAPVIESVFDDVGTPHMLLPGEVTDDARPTLSGTAPAKHTVQLYDGATYLGETVADARGNWSFTPTVALPEGPHNITATATDKIGNVSEPSGPFPLTTDYTAPAASDAVLSDNVGPVQGPIAHGSVTDDSTPTYAGNAEPNTTVVVYDHGKEIGRTQTNGAGDWTFTPTVPLTIGQHSFSHTVVDEAGNSSAPSKVIDFSMNDSGDDHASLAESKKSISVTFIADISNSMAGAKSANQVQSMKALAEAYAKMNVPATFSLIAFGNSATHKGTFTFTGDKDPNYAKLIAAINSTVSAYQNTNFDNALTLASQLIKAEYAAAGNNPFKMKQVFFLSDGYPYPYATSAATLKQWQALMDDPDGKSVTSNPIEVTTVAIGASAGLPALNQVSTSGTTVAVANPADLKDAVIDQMFVSWAYGSLLKNDTQVVMDAKAKISQFTVGNEVFRITAADQLAVDNASGKVGATYDKASGVLTLKTDAGQLTVFMKSTIGHSAGDYIFRAYASDNDELTLGGSIEHVFGYTAVNSKGESQTSKLYITDKLPQVGTDSVTVTQMGKDEGVAGNYVTADNSGGRLIAGTLKAALADGLSLQVSTDGGASWHNAALNGGNWAFVDTQAHPGDWKIQTRVVDDKGNNSGVLTTQDVAWVSAAAAPTIVRIAEAEGVYTTTKAQDGSQVLLSLAGTGAKVGDKVHVQWGASTYDQVLTQADITNGTATLKVPSSVTYSYQGAAKDFAVTAQIIGKDGALGAVSQPYNVVGTFTTTMVGDTLQKAPVGDVYTGTGFKVTTSGTLAKTAVTTTTLAGLTLSDGAQANALFTLDKPANYVSLRLTGIDNATGARIQVFDVKGNLIHTADFIGGTDARHTKTFTYTSAALVDIGSFKVVTQSPSVTLDAFNHRVVNHVAETRDPNLIEYAPETFYGGAGDDVVSLQISATTYFNQAMAAVHGGSGIDTLKLVGAAHALNLTKAAGKLSSMEVIDITGTGNNTLTLSLAEVLNNGGLDLFHTGDKSRVQMMVKGNAGDIVNLSDLLPNKNDQGDWLKKASVNVQGVVYDVYQFSTLAAELLVQKGVTVKLSNVALKAFSVDDVASDDVLDHSTHSYTAGDDALIARLGFADRLSGGAGNDTFTNVGTGDLVYGGSGDDVIHVLSGDFERVDGGLGIDTLVMDGKAMHIDLSAFGLKIQGFEKFDLGAGGNKLSLHAADVLAGGVRDMVTADGKVQMLVNGANGDVDLLGGSDGWTQGGNTTVGDVTYSVYTNLAGTAELLVEDKVHVTIM